MLNKDYPWIFLDVDETLVQTLVGTQASNSSKRKNFKLGSYWYSPIIRPKAQELIDYCRSISLCRILTVGTSDYIAILNDMYGWDFSVEDMTCRDEYIEYVPDGWGGYGGSARETAVVLSRDNFQNAILVDNQELDLPNARIKREWLGIGPERYIQIREFDGKDPESFNEELEDIKMKLKYLVNNY